MHPRLLLDLSLADLAFATRALVTARDAHEAAVRVESQFAPGRSLACLSVRSGFDALLAALALPAGTEVLFSAITIPDMPRVATMHGLVPVPVDLDPQTLAPRLDALQRAWSPRSKVLVVAHLFGGRIDLAPFAEFARRHDLLLVEDCAQAFRDPAETGDPRADVSMFSFGAIKTMTALGGAILTFRDPHLLARVRALDATRPVLPTAWFAKKLAKLGALRLVGTRRPYGLVAKVATLAGQDLDDVVGPAVKGFPLPPVPPGADPEVVKTQALAERIRFRPPAALLALLAHRLETWTPHFVARRAEVGERVLQGIPAGFSVPGARAHDRTHWLFAVDARDRREVVRTLRARGFDASCSTSAIHAVAAPPTRPETRPIECEALLAELVFLPVHPGLAQKDVDQLLRALTELETRTGPYRRTSPYLRKVA